MKAKAVALIAGVVFALGLGLAGMTQPSKILAFLDVGGRWDPSLAFVMLGAVGVHAIFVRRARRLAAPRYASQFAWPTATGIDARLLAGAALFGLGWGLVGYCPGPALVALASFAPKVVLFVGSMLAGMLVADRPG